MCNIYYTIYDKLTLENSFTSMRRGVSKSDEGHAVASRVEIYFHTHPCTHVEGLYIYTYHHIILHTYVIVRCYTVEMFHTNVL